MPGDLFHARNGEHMKDNGYMVSIHPDTVAALARVGYRITLHAQSGDLRFTPPTACDK